MKVIVYWQNGLCIIHPTQENELNIQKIACDNVPNGVPFLIMNKSVLPFNREFRQAWTADFSSPDGYGGQT